MKESFKIVHIHRGIEISFTPSEDYLWAEPPHHRDGGIVRTIQVDWAPSLHDTLMSIETLPVPETSLDPALDAYIDIVERDFGPCKLLKLSADKDRDGRLRWVTDGCAIETRHERRRQAA